MLHMIADKWVNRFPSTSWSNRMKEHLMSSKKDLGCCKRNCGLTSVSRIWATNFLFCPSVPCANDHQQSPLWWTTVGISYWSAPSTHSLNASSQEFCPILPSLPSLYSILLQTLCNHWPLLHSVLRRIGQDMSLKKNLIQYLFCTSLVKSWTNLQDKI